MLPLLFLTAPPPAELPQLAETARVPFSGPIAKDKNLSGAARVGDLLVVGSDETNAVVVLRNDGARYRVHGDPVVLDPAAGEIDIEGLAADGTTVYVTGSHARVRKKPDGRTPAAAVDDQPARHQVFRFTLKADGTAGPVERASLTPFLKADPVLGPFLGVAGKENGVDVEGLAVADGKLHFGFRGPVLRGGLVPVVSARFDDLASASVRYVTLGGRGVRDLAAVEGGFLILAGPVGDGDQDARVYFWDGTADARPLARVPPREGNPEGLVVLSAGPGGWDVLVLFDGEKDGGATRYAVPNP